MYGVMAETRSRLAHTGPTPNLLGTDLPVRRVAVAATETGLAAELGTLCSPPSPGLTLTP